MPHKTPSHRCRLAAPTHRPRWLPVAAALTAALASGFACSEDKKSGSQTPDDAGASNPSSPAVDAAMNLTDAADAPQDDAGAPGVVSREALLGAIASCTVSVLDDFAGKAGALETAIKAWAAAPDDTTLQAAQAAFRAAWDVWQTAEVMQFGPAAPFSAIGGQGLRDQIYSWPLTSRCAIEEQIVARGWESPSFASSLVNRRGLAALEYLLFYAGADSACPATSPIIATGSWAALDAVDRAARMRAYAAAVATDVVARSQTLRAAWAPGQGDFVTKFSRAGAGNPLFPSAQKALNAAYDALLYIELGVKDAKLAPPLGLRDCPAASCPELLESRFAHLALAAVRANLNGFSRIMFGCQADGSGLGFDDLLVAVGGADLAARLQQRTTAVGAALAAISEPDLGVAIAQRPASVRAIYDAWKGVTDLLKTEVLTVLDLELPKNLEGDND
jgi:uncharacterized protein